MYLINIAKHDVLNGRVLKDLTYDTAIPASNNKNFFGVGMSSEWDVRNHLLIAGAS